MQVDTCWLYANTTPFDLRDLNICRGPITNPPCPEVPRVDCILELYPLQLKGRVLTNAELMSSSP